MKNNLGSRLEKIEMTAQKIYEHKFFVQSFLSFPVWNLMLFFLHFFSLFKTFNFFALSHKDLLVWQSAIFRELLQKNKSRLL